MCISLGEIIKLLLNQVKVKSFLEANSFNISKCLDIVDRMPEMSVTVETFNDFENYYDYILCRLYPFVTLNEFNLLKKHKVLILGIVMELFECITD